MRQTMTVVVRLDHGKAVGCSVSARSIGCLGRLRPGRVRLSLPRTPKQTDFDLNSLRNPGNVGLVVGPLADRGGSEREITLQGRPEAAIMPPNGAESRG
jgi:hypothetical protein